MMANDSNITSGSCENRTDTTILIDWTTSNDTGCVKLVFTFDLRKNEYSLKAISLNFSDATLRIVDNRSSNVWHHGDTINAKIDDSYCPNVKQLSQLPLLNHQNHSLGTLELSSLCFETRGTIEHQPNYDGMLSEHCSRKENFENRKK